MNPWLEKDGVRYAYFSDVMKRAALCKSPTTRSFRTSWNSGIVRNSEAIMALGKVGKIFIRVRPARAARARRNPLDGQQIKIPQAGDKGAAIHFQQDVRGVGTLRAKVKK